MVAECDEQEARFTKNNDESCANTLCEVEWRGVVAQCRQQADMDNLMCRCQKDGDENACASLETAE